VESLKREDLLLKVEDYTHNVGYSERSNVPIEPYLSEQWFLKYPQVPRSTDAVEKGEIKFYPERWTKTYAHWMRNLRDWCISRQLWWGHRIPVWYRGEEIYCGLDTPKGDGWQQDPDVLDTWFSSWLWPFATMHWTGDKVKDAQNSTLKKFYPTTDLVTAPEIIFFWVARMIMSGYEYMDEKSFANVYFTGIVRDTIGRKMSKSLGNSPDPLDLIGKYGADGVRFGMMLCAPLGQDIHFDEKRCELGRNFMNKLWNAARFIQMQRAANPPSRAHNAHDLNILGTLAGTTSSVSTSLDAYKFNEAAKHLYDFVWGGFCDWYIEASKASPNIAVLDNVFSAILRMLHPFAPFITEELWRGMGYGSETIQFAPWPDHQVDAAAFDVMPKVDALYGAVTAGRQLRNDNGIEPRKKVAFVIKPSRYADFFKTEIQFLTQVLSAETVTIDPNYASTGLTPSLVTQTATVFMVGAVDPAAERQRLTKQLADIERQLKATDAKLANESFVSKAAPIAVQRERDRQQQLREQQEKIKVLLRALQ
jgi:valyl-tRNA synthetase